jgi:hypothetical protein
MPTQLTSDDFKQSLNSHVALKGAEVREKYGPNIGWTELQRILEDRACVRYPCEIRFGAQSLLEGETAHPVSNGERPEEGFTIVVHPHFASDVAECVHLVLYQLVLVNYGEFASSDDAETFGSTVLGLPKDEYYERLCELADRLGMRRGK